MGNSTYITGVEFSVCHSFTNKDICNEIGRWYTWTGLKEKDIAQEIYSHAMAYYYFGNVKKVLDEDTSNELKKHANPINLGGDRLVDKGLVLAYKLIWITTKGT